MRLFSESLRCVGRVFSKAGPSQADIAASSFSMTFFARGYTSTFDIVRYRAGLSLMLQCNALTGTADANTVAHMAVPDRR